MWTEVGTEGKRNGEIRIKEAIGLGAKIIATACPFCLLTLEDATKTSGLSAEIIVRDIAELVVEALETNSNNQISNSK